MSTEHPEYTRNFADVYLAELDYVKQRREQMDIPVDRIAPEIERVQKLKAQTEKLTEASTTPSQQAPHLHVANADTGLVGLALSGGGIRSATFNLGLLQSLAKNNVLQYCDYLSTVSGGGYIGSCLNSLLADNKDYSTKPAEFPFRENDSKTLGERAEVNHLRATKNYLGLGGGGFLDIWYMLGTTVSGMLLMSLVPLAFTFLAILLFYFIPFEKPVIQNQNFFWYELAIILVAIFVLLIFTRMVMIRLRLILLFFKHSSESHIRHNKRIAWRTAIASLVAGTSLLIGFIYWLAWNSVGQHQTFVYILLASLLVILVGLLSTSNNKFQQTVVKVIMSIALTILVFSLFSWLLSGWYEDERLEQFARVMKQEPIQSEVLTENFQHLQLYLGMSDIETPTWENQFIEALGGKKAVTANGETVAKVRNEAKRFLKIKQWIQSEGLTQVLTQMKWLSDELKSNNNISTFSTSLDEIWQLIKTSDEKQEWINKLVEAMQQVNKQTLSVKFSVAKWKIIVVIVFLGIGLLININRNSLHYFYRDRLSKTYLIKWNNSIQQNHALLLKELHQCYNGPYYLVNTTLNVPRSANSFLSGRGTDFFIFSKYYCGAESTGYRSTESYRHGQTKLATAMAISGAAVSPQMGTHTKLIMVILMTLLNARLNMWMPNPNRRHLSKFTFWPTYLFKELFRTSTENDALLNLSDGGHHENLGIYPLLKRRCRVIIASDASADPKFQMDDLANLQRKARIDLGIDIELDMTDLSPALSSGYSKTHFVKGIIHYPNNKKGILFYIKTTLTGTEPQDLLAYRRRHPSFPDETTADQFFNEDQFESYRKLGELSGDEVFSKEEDVKTIFGLDE